MNAQLQFLPSEERAPARPRLGFLGLGWIGRQRMQVLRASGAAQVAVIADPHADALQAAAVDAPEAACAASLDELLEHDLDGLVIATPNALHAWQAIAALRRGIAVFCQKPLGRNAAEVAQVISAARHAGRPLGADFSYRHLAGIGELREATHRGELGQIYGADLVFHNAYGPDKPWFDDLAQSGGGCVMDLGIHLVDLADWIVGDAGDELDARLYAKGKRLRAPVDTVEDYAVAQWCSESGACVRMACSWRLPAGREAIIEAAFYGTRGGAALRNVGGSFYDFTLERFDGTRSETLASPPDAWGGRALVQWAQALAADAGFDEDCERLLRVARVADRIYGR